MKLPRLARRARGERAGSALIIVLLTGGVLATLSFSLVAVSFSGAREQRGAKEQMRARYVCEAGLAEAVFELSKGGSGNLGSKQNPVSFGDGRFWVASTALAPDVYRLSGTGLSDRSGSALELTVRRSDDNLFRFAAFGDLLMDLDANANVDSYDSTAGTYAAQAVNGSGADIYANVNGNIGSNNDIETATNVMVYGSATPGPYGATTVTGNSQVLGSIAPMAETVTLPAINVPTIASSGASTISGPTPTTLVSGDYHYTTLSIKANCELVLQGPARIVVDDFKMFSNSKFNIDASAGPVEFYVNGDFIMASNTFLGATDFKPASLKIQMLSDNIMDPNTTVQLDTVSLSSNTEIYATLYAPEALIDMNSNIQVYGSVVARKVHMDSYARIHYDEALGSGSATSNSVYQIVCWRPLAYHP